MLKNSQMACARPHILHPLRLAQLELRFNSQAWEAKKSSQGASRRIVLNPVCLDIVGPVLCIVRWFGTLQRGRGPLAVPQISHPPCVVAVSPVFGNANESCDKVMHVSPRQNSSRAGVSKRRSGWKMTGIQ